MSVSISSAYGMVNPGSAGNKLYVPVNPAKLLYSHFTHVSGFAAGKNQHGVSITKIQILNTLIDHLSSLKSGKRTANTAVTPEQVDSIIDNYQTQIRQIVKAAETTPYILTGARPEAGVLFSISE
ncbi:MAG: hypothetical protein ACTTKL_03730 [Treponema sp.]